MWSDIAGVCVGEVTEKDIFHFYGNSFLLFVDPFAVCICRRVAVSNGVVGSQKTERLYLCGWHSWAPRQLKLLTKNVNTNTYTNQDICTNMYYKKICTRNIHL